QAALRFEPGRAITDIHKKVARDVSPVDETADFLDKRLVEDIKFAVGRAVQNVQAIQEAASGAAPVTRAFVAAPIRRMKPQEAILAAQHLVNDSLPPVRVRFGQQRGREDAG